MCSNTAEGLANVDTAFTDLLDIEHRALAALPEAIQPELAGLLRTLTQQFETLS